MRKYLKYLASKLPARYQQELKRLHFRRQMSRGRFRTGETEYDLLEQWVHAGDMVLDIGANVGHYTSKLSRLVGDRGRVIAFEPVPATFALLTANAERFPCKNVTLLNVAASDRPATRGMKIPTFDTGLENYYMAELTTEGAGLQVFCFPVDALNLASTVTLVKIDVEGHEMAVLSGMRRLLDRDHPLLIIEGDSDEIASYLQGLSYSYEKLSGSPNRVYTHSAS